MQNSLKRLSFLSSNVCSHLISVPALLVLVALSVLKFGCFVDF